MPVERRSRLRRRGDDRLVRDGDRGVGHGRLAGCCGGVELVVGAGDGTVACGGMLVVGGGWVDGGGSAVGVVIMAWV